VYFGLAGTLADLLSGYRACAGEREALSQAQARLKREPPRSA
jgi:hypothetical protein